MAASESSHHVIIAQCESFSKKMPAFYAAIVACMIAQVVVFYGRAPIALGIIIPALIAVIAIIRMTWWIRRRRNKFSELEARTYLRKSKSSLFASTAAIICFDVVLFQYVDEFARNFMILQVFGCTMVGVYCLMHLRAAAYVMIAALFISLPFTLGTYPIDIAIGSGIAIVTLAAAMGYAMQSYYLDFLSLIRTKHEAQSLSAENHRLANLDTLTGIANRRQFFQDLEVSCASSHRSGRPIAVAIADLDGFKPINDTHGHVIGDRVLQAVAARIREGASGFDAVYRLGGDEFALIANEVRNGSDLVAHAQELIQIVGQPISLGELVVSTGCSIGVAVFPDSASTTELLYERADYALYHAKRSGRNQALIFTEEHEQLLRTQGAIEQALRSADLANEFYIAYQPIVRASDGQTLSFECLARWRSPSLGDVSPGAFIPVAEQSGLIASLTPVLLRMALEEAKNWPDDVRISFNLSPHDIASRERILAVMAIVGQSSIAPSRIDLELTETALLNNFDVVLENMNMLKAIGINLSLDDFGTGYSSLSHVHALPLDKIKIDRSFVTNLAESTLSRTVMRSMMTLCRDLQIACVVEGVETDGQVKALSELGCEQIQGYYFSKPLPAKEISSFLGRTERCAA